LGEDVQEMERKELLRAKQAHVDRLTGKEAMQRKVNRNRAMVWGSPAKTPQNAPCPCKSNKKYKKCCGRVVVPAPATAELPPEGEPNRLFPSVEAYEAQLKKDKEAEAQKEEKGPSPASVALLGAAAALGVDPLATPERETFTPPKGK